VDKEGNEVENGMRVENVSMSLEMMKDDDQKILFSGVSGGDEVVFDVKKAYPNDTELASLLRGSTKPRLPCLRELLNADYRRGA
jgi:trigger factor